jgi:hypothetical protein
MSEVESARSATILPRTLANGANWSVHSFICEVKGPAEMIDRRARSQSALTKIPSISTHCGFSRVTESVMNKTAQQRIDVNVAELNGIATAK